MKQSDKCPDCIIILSERKLSLNERNALKFGFSHPILPKKVEKDKIKCSIEKLVYTFTRNTGINVDEGMKDDIKFLLRKFTDDADRACMSRVNQSMHNALKKISQDFSIKVCKFDKGNGLAILDSTDYDAKLHKIIQDKSKFVEIRQDTAIHPIIQKENSIAYYIRRYLKNKEGYTKLIPSGSKPGKLYGMA